MQPDPPARSSKISAIASIALLLLAMLLPVCHSHPLLDKTAPDHCSICITLHAALPIASHVAPIVGLLLPVDRVPAPAVRRRTERESAFDASRAPPHSAC